MNHIFVYIFLQNYVYTYIPEIEKTLKLLLGRTYADRGTKIIAVQDGRRNRKRACVSFVSKSIDAILNYYFTEIHK